MFVQRGSYEFVGTTLSHAITLDTPVPDGESFPIVTVRNTSHSTSQSMVKATLSDVVSGAYTKIQLERGHSHSTDNVPVEWQVVTSPLFSVQHAELTMSDASITDTIVEIDTSEAFLVFSNTTGRVRARDSFVRGNFSNATTVQFVSESATGTRVISYYAVEMQGASVQAHTTSMTTTFRDIGISEVDLAKTFLLFSYSVDDDYDEVQNQAEINQVRGYFHSSTVVSFKRESSNNYCELSCYVIEHDDFNVESGSMSITGTSDIANITADMLPNTFALSSGKVAGGSNTTHYGFHTALLYEDSGNKIELERAVDTNTLEATWFSVNMLIQPDNLVPDALGILPQEEMDFTWQVDMLEQTHYEVQYKVQGAASWETTGQIISAEEKHAFSAYTFDPDKDYEWRVRTWNIYGGPYSWSEVATFSTIYPIIRTPSPVSIIEIGVQEYSAQVLTPERSGVSRDAKLHIEIADNAIFTDATVYETAFVESGQRAEIIHAIAVPGNYHVKMQAEDTTGLLSDELEYEITALQLLYFLEAPNVQIRGPQATHITVQSPTNEYTASLGGITDDKKIERLVEIDEGNAGNCQVVAEQLLARWGREQVSVSGAVNLAVTLSFREEVKIIIPEANINQGMVLQKKEHDVTGARTIVTCGDIILGDTELLARILDEL